MLQASHFQVTVEVNKRSAERGSLLQQRLFRSNQGGGGSDADTLTIHALNVDTRDEFETVANVVPDYTQKIIQWVAKGKYACSQAPPGALPEGGEDTLNIKVDEVFGFTLRRKAKTEIEKIKEQMKSI